MRLSITWGDNTPGLSLDVGEVTIVVDDDVACLSGGLGSNNTLGGDDLSGEGGLVLVGVDLDLGVVVVGGVFKEVLLQVEGSSVCFVVIVFCYLFVLFWICHVLKG